VGVLWGLPLGAFGGGNVADVAKALGAKTLWVAFKVEALAILSAVGEIEERIGTGV
jgi:hypothetical protein